MEPPPPTDGAEVTGPTEEAPTGDTVTGESLQQCLTEGGLEPRSEEPRFGAQTELQVPVGDSPEFAGATLNVGLFVYEPAEAASAGVEEIEPLTESPVRVQGNVVVVGPEETDDPEVEANAAVIEGCLPPG